MKKSIFYTRVFIPIGVLLVLLGACKKDFLDVRPDKALLVPSTTADFRALLDNNFLFGVTPALTWIADGDTYTTAEGFNFFASDQERNSYTWSADVFGTASSADWNLPYQQIFYANIVLEGAEAMPPTENAAGDAEIREIRGSALFHRAFAFYQLAQQFAPPYRAATAETDPGIPLRIRSTLTEKVGRASVAETYRQILSDLLAARPLLPRQALYKSRPNLAAAYGLLANTYLAMEDYDKAGRYADSCLQLHPGLLDYNGLDAGSYQPFPRPLPNGNDEVIFYAVAVDYSFMSSFMPTLVDPALYDSYTGSDLRKSLFFEDFPPGHRFRGNYAGIISSFSGLAADEMYLLRAECAARAGKTDAAMADLNRLLVTRWRSGAYVPLHAAGPEAALRLVLTERRKELTGRGMRWKDLRRLNSDPRFAVTLQREMSGQRYRLEPGSKRYTYPIPADEIKLNNGVQNER